MKCITSTGIALALAAVAQAEDSGSAMRATLDEASGRVLVTDAGKPVLNYNYQSVPVPAGVADGPYAKARSNYLHPIYGPDGEELTSDWSKDHPHHRGIYWAWPEVGFQGEVGDLHALQRVWARPTGKIATGRTGEWAGLEAESRWMWEERTSIVRELARIRAGKAGPHGRYIDLTFRFEALEDGVTLARRGTDQYGGLNIRLAPIEGLQLVHHADPVEAVPRIAWQAVSGRWAGADHPLALVVFEQASNPRYPGDYVQYPDLPWLQPTFPKAGERYALIKGEPLTLRYRIWIRRGPPPTGEELRKQWAIYQESEDQ